MWVEEFFHVKKPIIAMCHIRALPGDPAYDREGGMEHVIDCARKDLKALQDGGVDGIIFSNEFSLPYTSAIEPVTLCAMARIIEAVRPDIRVPYGVDIIDDAYHAVDLAVATGATFIRGAVSGSFVSMDGSVDLDPGRFTRHRYALGGENIRIFSYVVPEGCDYVGKRTLAQLAKKAEFGHSMDTMCVAGLVAGSAVDTADIETVKNAVKHTPVFVNTGCKKETIVDLLKVADGAISATTFKYDGVFENLVDYERVKAFMDVVKEFRKTL